MSYAPEYERRRRDAPSDVDRVAAYRIGLAAASSSRRKSPIWFATLAIVSSIAVAATVFAVINYRRANEWQDRTRAADQRATELQADLGATNAQLDLAQTELKVMSIGLDASNKDRDALQAQIDALTAEQTNAGDQPLTNQASDGGVLATSDP